MATPLRKAIRIFVSHSHVDNEFGIRLVQDLRNVLNNESAVWYDDAGGLHGGDTWFDKIMEELSARNIFIVILSPDAIASMWVADELRMAWMQKNSPQGKTIIPILYRDCKFPRYLEMLQIVSFVAPIHYDTGFSNLLTALGLPTLSEPRTLPEEPGKVLIKQMLPDMDKAFNNKDWPDVIRKADFLIKNAPADVSSQIYRMQGIALQKQERTKQACEAFEAALALVSNSKQRLVILKEYTETLAVREQWDKVLHNVEEALRLKASDAEWLSLKRKANEKLNPPKPVKTPVQEPKKPANSGAKTSSAPTTVKPSPAATPPKPSPVTTEPKKPAATSLKTKEQWLKGGNTHQSNQRYKEAIAEYDRAIQLDSGYLLAYYNRGLAYYNLREYQQALKDLNKVLQLNTGYTFAYYYRGEVYRILNKSQQALTDFSRAIELGNISVNIYTSRGNVYHVLKHYTQALEDLNTAIQLDAGYAQAYYYRGLTYYETQKHQQAHEDFSRAIQLDAKNAAAYYYRGIIYYDFYYLALQKALADFNKYLPLLDQAIADFNKAIELETHNAAFYHNRGDTYRLLNRNDEAIRDLTRAIELQPDFARPYASRGDVYYTYKQYQRAFDDFSRALQLDPGLEWVKAKRDKAYQFINTLNIY